MKKLLVCLAVSTVLFTGCSFMPNTNGIIKVNDKIITQADFDKAFDKGVDNSFLQQFGGSKNVLKTEQNPFYNVFKEKIVNELIIKTLIDDEIEKRHIEASKEEVQEELKRVIDKVGSKEELNKILKNRGISNSQFTDDLKTQITIRKLVESIDKVEVSDAEVKKFYDSNPKEFTHGEQVRASHILISANPVDFIRIAKEKNPNISNEELNKQVEKQMAEAKTKAQTILIEVKNNPQDFAKIATQKSDDRASGEHGGELGFFPKEAMVPEFSKVAFSIKPNTISDLVQTQYGYHIIKVTDRMEAGKTPYAKVKDEIKFYLETQKQIAILKNLTSGLMKTAKIEYLDEHYNPAKSINVTPEPQQTKKAEK